MDDYIAKLDEDLRKKMDRLRWMHNEPTLHVAEHFAELRRQVDNDADFVIAKMIQSMRGECEACEEVAMVKRTRLEFVRILKELEERTQSKSKPQIASSEVFSSLEQRVDKFKDSSSSPKVLEESYIQLAREIIAEADRVEQCLLGEQTIIYWPSKRQDRFGSLVYFGDVFLSEQQIDRLMAEIFSKEETRRIRCSGRHFELLEPSYKAFELNTNNKMIWRINKEDLRRFAESSKFWYIGKTKSNYSGYSAEESSIDREFVSYQYDDLDKYDEDFDEDEQNLTEEANYGFDNLANLFDDYSLQTCTLSIRNARLNGLHANLLPSPVDRLVTLHLIDVHLLSFDTELLATLTSLTELKMQVTFSKQVTFDLAFLGALRKLKTLELSLPHSPSDLSAFKELIDLTDLKLEGSSFFYAVKRPRLSKTALAQILSAPRLERLELSCFDIESIDRNMFSKCKHLLSCLLTRNQIDRMDDNDASVPNIGPSVGFANPEENNSNQIRYIKLIYSDIRALNASSFAGMINLQELSLTGNLIADLPCGIFDGLTFLIQLELDKNLIRHIRSGVFDNLKELKELKLDRNPIESIEANAFAELHSLKELSLVGCRLKSIESEMFNGLIGLISLNLLKLKKLDLNCFRNLSSLRKLDLSANMINELSGNVGPELLAVLNYLMINNNRLVSIHKSAIPKSLLVLYLSNNQLERLDDDFFADFRVLAVLNLACNQLTMTVTNTTFSRCNYSLFQINLSENKSIQVAKGALLHLPKQCIIMCDYSEHLACLPLFYTLKIGRLTPEVVRLALQKLYQDQPERCLDLLQIICLSGCSINTLTRNSNGESELEWSELGQFDLSWLPKVSKLRQIEISNNCIETLDDSELFADFKSINEINLSRNRLSRIHRDIFKCLPQLSAIDLSCNSLASIDTGLFRHQRSLKHLNLSSNNIAFLNLARLFRICSQLESLNIADNQLDDRSTAEPIGANTICFMRNLNLANNRFEKMDFVRDMTSLERLDLRGNRIESLLSNHGENLLGRLSKLTHLDLSQNRIRSMRDEMFDHLYHQLSFVNLSGNPCDFQLDSVLNEII